MFLEKCAARLFSFAVHTAGLAALLTVPTAAPLPSIDPPCADAVVAWMPARPWMFSPPTPTRHQSLDPTFEITPAADLGDLGLGAEKGYTPPGILALPPLLPILPSTPPRAGEDVPAPAKLVDVAPRYPPLARQLHLDGVVVLDATIDEEGRVIDLRMLRSMRVFDRSAMEAVRQWRYAPAMREGLPVRVLLTVTVAFTLHG
jgi:TonB family protein